MKRSDFSFYSTYLLAHEAEREGIKVEKVFSESRESLLRLTKINGEEVYLIGQKLASVPYSSYYICRNKELTKRCLAESAICVPKGKAFVGLGPKEVKKYLKNVDFPIVIKPVRGTWGANVHADVKNLNQAMLITDDFISQKKDFLIEERCEGDEYRILSTSSKLLGVINRIPANVIGNGVDSIENLISEKNKDSRRGLGHERSLVKIEINKEVKKYLKEKKKSLTDVPKADEVVYLRSNSNLSTGGDSVDVTDEVHPKYQQLTPAIIKSIPGLLYGGIDLITKDITKDPFKVGYVVLEINESPMISMHHEPYIGKKRNVAKEIIALIK